MTYESGETEVRLLSLCYKARRKIAAQLILWVRLSMQVDYWDEPHASLIYAGHIYLSVPGAHARSLRWVGIGLLLSREITSTMLNFPFQVVSGMEGNGIPETCSP